MFNRGKMFPHTSSNRVTKTRVSTTVDIPNASRSDFGQHGFSGNLSVHPVIIVSHAASATVFLQYATQEPFLTPAVAREFEKVVSKPRRFKLYDAPHALNAEARRDRIAFLTEQLKLKPLRAQVVDAIPDLYQPPRSN